jgi:hypothetical protein
MKQKKNPAVFEFHQNLIKKLFLKKINISKFETPIIQLRNPKTVDLIYRTTAISNSN